MLPTKSGSFRLFKFAGVTVYLHWMWFLLAVYELSYAGRYTSRVWNGLEFLTLFGIVLMHEFGHALACRSVGGEADQIVLWPLGGVAYVNPPQRPGATLWSIAAGPLVNVVLLVPLTAMLGFAAKASDMGSFLRMVWLINTVLLVFNLLPVYPLDGGQIVRSVLWFFLGRAKSLLVATVIGFIGAAGLVVLALWMRSMWMGLVTVFIFVNCWRGWQMARLMIKVDKLPRRSGYTCPSCGAAPLLGPLWKCAGCGTHFDTFETGAICPQCRTRFDTTHCTDCGQSSPLIAWGLKPPVVAE